MVEMQTHRVARPPGAAAGPSRPVWRDVAHGVQTAVIPPGCAVPTLKRDRARGAARRSLRSAYGCCRNLKENAPNTRTIPTLAISRSRNGP